MYEGWGFCCASHWIWSLQRPLLPRQRSHKPSWAIVLISLNSLAQILPRSIAILVIKWVTSNVIVTIGSNLRVVVRVLAHKDSVVPLLKLTKRLYRFHYLPWLNKQLWILCHYCTHPQMRARMITFVLYKSMTVVASHTLHKFNSK